MRGVVVGAKGSRLLNTEAFDEGGGWCGDTLTQRRARGQGMGDDRNPALARVVRVVTDGTGVLLLDTVQAIAAVLGDGVVDAQGALHTDGLAKGGGRGVADFSVVDELVEAVEGREW